MDHLIIDCETGEATTVPFTADEVAAQAADAATAATRDAAEQAARATATASRARLDELKAKGYINLTGPERAEVQDLMLQFA